MANFICKVLTPQGQIVKIKVNEKDKISCLKKLKRNGMVPIDVKKSFSIFKKDKKRNLNSKILSTTSKKNKKQYEIPISNKVSLSEVKEFTKTLYLLKKSNFTNSHALITIINNTDNVVFKKCLRDILKSIEEGKYMYKVMKEYKNVFPLIYVNFIKTGELTDNFEDSLKYAITYLEDEEKIRSKITNILVPNIFMFFGIIIVIAVAILIGVPNLQNLLLESGSKTALPKVTVIVSKILIVLIKTWYIWVISIVIGVSILIKFSSTKDGKYRLDKFLYSNGLVGKIHYLLDFTRIIRSIYLNLKNKMRIEDALEISKNVTKNSYMHNTIEKSISNLYVGKSWLEPFEEEKILSTVTTELLKKGFSIKSEQTIQSTINYLDKKLEEEIEIFLKKILEISYIIVGLTLLVFVLIVFIPYLQILLSQLLFI